MLHDHHILVLCTLLIVFFIIVTPVGLQLTDVRRLIVTPLYYIISAKSMAFHCHLKIHRNPLDDQLYDLYPPRTCCKVTQHGTVMELEIGFNVHIQSKLLQHTFVVGASFDLGQLFRPRHVCEYNAPQLTQLRITLASLLLAHCECYITRLFVNKAPYILVLFSYVNIIYSLNRFGPREPARSSQWITC